MVNQQKTSQNRENREKKPSGAGISGAKARFSSKNAPNTSKSCAGVSRACAEKCPCASKNGFERTVCLAMKSARELAEDIKVIKDRDPAADGIAEVLMYSGLHAVLLYRLSHMLYKTGHKVAARFVSQTARFFTGIEIHPGAKIGRGLFIDHGSGVVIGETAELGDNCTLYQGVTLGGTGKDVGKRHPTLGDNVMVGAGAKVLGPFKIGSNSKIAANAVVLEEIPENSTAVGIPARVVKRDNVKVGCDLDQIHIPDPVAQEICRLRIRLEALEKQIETLEKSSAGAKD